MSKIYTDNGAANGLRTRLFRNTDGGVEWIYAVDYADGSDRWFFFHPGVGRSVEEMISKGVQLEPYEPEGDGEEDQ